MFDSMTEMVEVIELIYNENDQPIALYIRNVNHYFGRLLGKTKKQLINKKTSSIESTTESSWIKNFARVDKTRMPHSFKNYEAEVDKYYFVTVWKVSKNSVGVSLVNITNSEKNEIELKKRQKKERIETDFILKEKGTVLNSTIDKLDTMKAKLALQKEEKEERAAELVIAKKEKTKRIHELVLPKMNLPFERKRKRNEQLN
ncbi:hypothetical protein [Polaribacter sp.]|jgi:hypothetical protein|uniref:hypothetical protein n=1 Tax=Polaribacter sp. TaxID=1920175 RepID=UPI003EEDC4FB